MMRKMSGLMTTAAVMVAAFTLNSFAGQWVQRGADWYYQNDNGSYAKNQWVENYYLGSDGIMYTNSLTPDGYYVDATGKWDGKPSVSIGTTQEPVNALGQIIYNSPLVDDAINWNEKTISYGGTPVEIIESTGKIFYDRGTYYEVPNCEILGPFFDEYGDHGYYAITTGPMYVRKNALVENYDPYTGATITMTAEQVVQKIGSLQEDGYSALRTIGCATSFDANGYITKLSVHPFE